jgi:TadE-like protein
MTLRSGPLANRPLQRGASMVEFTIVAPVLSLIGLLVIQWALVFHARNTVNHASFMAARAGSTGQAQMATMDEAYHRALAPLYGGGRNLLEVEAAVLRARADLAGNMRLELLNPTAESFDDWADAALQQRLGLQARVIPNDGLALQAEHRVRAASGQTLADANLLKIRITHAMDLRVPLANTVIRFMLRFRDDGRDAFVTNAIARGRLAMHFDATVHMQSAAVEQEETVAVAGRANAAEGRDAADVSDRGEEPVCVTVACTVTRSPGSTGSSGSAPLTPAEPGGGGAGGGSACDPATGQCPYCPA